MRSGKMHVLSGESIVVNNYSILFFYLHFSLNILSQVVTSLSVTRARQVAQAKAIDNNDPRWKKYVKSAKQILLYVEFCSWKKVALKIQSNLTNLAGDHCFFHRSMQYRDLVYGILLK